MLLVSWFPKTGDLRKRELRNVKYSDAENSHLIENCNDSKPHQKSAKILSDIE